jgi:hypothetical protein
LSLHNNSSSWKASRRRTASTRREVDRQVSDVPSGQFNVTPELMITSIPLW